MPCLLRARQGFTAVQQGTSRFFVCCVCVIVWYARASAEMTQHSLLRTQVHLVCVLEHHNTVYRGLWGLEPHNALRNGFCGSLHALCEHPYSYHAAVRFSLEHSKHVFYQPYRQCSLQVIAKALTAWPTSLAERLPECLRPGNHHNSDWCVPSV